MNLRLDPDVQAVAEFMQEHIAVDRLVGTAVALAKIAPSLWERYGTKDVIGLHLEAPAILGCGPQTRPCANG